MRLILLIKILLIASCLGVSALFAQSVPTLEDAVRDQYIDEMNEQELNEIANSDSLSGLDTYSHFLSENELIDVSHKRHAESFAILLTKQLLYIRIPIFHSKTSLQIQQAIKVAIPQSDAAYIIVDLRGNRGGLLNAAIEVADEFIATGVLATTTGRLDTTNLVFLAKPNGLLEGKKIAVLIDKNTASAAELLAGILKLDASACVIGQNSFGKSAVQTLIRLNNGDALSLTTAAYYFSNGKTVNKQGIVPDISISTWQLWRNPPYLINQKLNTYEISNPLIEKSMRCMDRQ